MTSLPYRNKLLIVAFIFESHSFLNSNRNDKMRNFVSPNAFKEAFSYVTL